MTTTIRSIRDLLTDTSGLRIAARGEPVAIHVDDAESAAVRTAVGNLASDLADSCGALPTVTSDAATARIVVGTVGRSPAVDDAVAAGLLDLSPLLDADGTPRWEGHLARVVGDKLFLVGADRRGTVFAVYDFTRAIGVSPWRWWADVPVRTREHVTVSADAVAADWPSVRYRGIFINDEEELDAWASVHTGDGTIGPETYARICELILRLKGNYLWPAMHVGAFNHDPDNGRVADELGIVVGTSHCDMLLRSNEHEFGPWAAAQGEPVEYDYSLPGRNRELLQEYWRGSVDQNRTYEVTWTVGMRGIHDYGFQTTAIDEDATLAPEEKFRAKVALLGRVIADQRDLLSGTLGVAPSQAPQLFIPYKEVLPLYDAGLEVPDDVTIVWANDNFGHVRRLPDAGERQRSGGHGLYYHCSYWSDLTTSYLATSSTPLALMRSELDRAWDAGIQRLWVNNIGGIKPLEHELEFFLTHAWEVGREPRTADPEAFTAAWVDSMFSGDHGPRVARIHAEYSVLNQQRKLEHLTTDVFGQVGHGDEAGRRLEALRLLHDGISDVLLALPEEERDAFFQLFVTKIHMAYLVNGQFVHADRSTLAHEQGKLAAADHHLRISRAFDANKRALIHSWNHVLAGGRWSGIFAPEHFPPPVLPLHPPATPALRIGAPGLGVVAWGERTPSQHPRLEFHPHGITTKWVEVFTTGAPGLAYEVEADPWIEVSLPGSPEPLPPPPIRCPEVLPASEASGAASKGEASTPHPSPTTPPPPSPTQIRCPEVLPASEASGAASKGEASTPHPSPTTPPHPSPTTPPHPSPTQIRCPEVLPASEASGAASKGEASTPDHLSSVVQTEHRVLVTVPDPLAAAGRTGTVRVTSPSTGEVVDVVVTMAAAPSLPTDFVGAIEADGHITLDPSQPDLTSPAWETVPLLGRYGNPALRAVATPHAQPPTPATFSFHLETPGPHLLEVHRLPTLDSTGCLRIGVGVDDLPPVALESPTTDEHRGMWRQAIQDNVEVLRIHLPALSVGPHVLHLHAMDAGVTLSKLAVYTAEAAPSNLGPGFSAHTDRPIHPSTDPDPTALDEGALADIARRVYRTDPAAVPPPDQVYAGDGFWEGATTFRPNTVRPQPSGHPRFTVAADGTKDLLAALGGGVVVESGGVIAYESENVLVEDTHSWSTPSLDDARHGWTHTQAETDGGTGLAMHVLPRRLAWPDPATAPAIHQRIRVQSSGLYRVWLLVKFDDRSDDACAVALDGLIQPPSEQFCGGELATYGTRQVWVWVLLTELDIPAGDRTFSVSALKSGLRVDRVFLTRSGSLPPTDADWVASDRLRAHTG